MKNRLFASLLAALMVLGMIAIIPASAAGDAAVISASTVSAAKGATEAEVVISISNVPAAGIASTKFNVKVEGASITDGIISDKLKNDNPEGEKFEGFVVIGPTAKSADVGVNFMSIDVGAGIKSDTDLVTFKIALPADAACGTKFPVKITLSSDPQDFIASDKTSTVDVESKDGEIVIAHTLSHVDAVAATADKDGAKEHWKCGDCGKLFADAQGAAEVTKEDLVVKYTDDQTPEDVLLGDVNNDTKINAKDVTAIMRHIIGKTPEGFNLKAADFNEDTKINAKDVTGVMKRIVSGK